MLFVVVWLFFEWADGFVRKGETNLRFDKMKIMNAERLPILLTWNDWLRLSFSTFPFGCAQTACSLLFALVCVYFNAG